MSLILPALKRQYPGNETFVLNTPEITLSDKGYTCVIGRNGSGKSSLGEALAEHRSDEQLWYYLPQYLDRILFAENLVEQLETMLSQTLDHSLLSELLYEFGFSEPKRVLDFPFILMSGGERRRVALSCIFYLQPKHIILDEPDIGITAKENMVLLSKIGNLKAVDTRVILISHNHEFVKGSSDLICLKEGRLDRVGKTDELLIEPSFTLSEYGVRFQRVDV
jgi:energy-coupling factor transporter ATP-binding protein EcfA2